MPNHFHGIIQIKKGHSRREDARPSPTISDIMCSFKSQCTDEYIEYIKQHKLEISAKIWHRSFHDRIIRNERSLYAIRKYILDNPINWEDDIDDLINL
jgi:putative transposase